LGQNFFSSKEKEGNYIGGEEGGGKKLVHSWSGMGTISPGNDNALRRRGGKTTGKGGDMRGIRALGKGEKQNRE